MTQRHEEIIIRIAWIVSLVGIMAAFLRPYMNQVIDAGRLMNYMPWLFPGQLYFDYFINASLLTFMLFKRSRLGAILLLFVFISDKLFMLISLHGFNTLYIYTWLIAQFIYGLVFIMAIWASFSHRHRITADLPDEGTVAKDLKSLWLGKIPLYTAFWAYIGGGLVAVIVIPGLSLIPVVGAVTSLLQIVILFIYMPVACIGAWRSAGAYAGKVIWAVLAKLGSLFIALLIAYILYNIFFSLSGFGVSKQGIWKQTLEARDFDGNPRTVEGYYDTQLDITWLADANYAKTISYDVDGEMAWTEARKWVESLDVYGIAEWRLPMERPLNGTAFDFERSENATTDSGHAPTTTDGTDGGWRNTSGEPVSEMGHMYYVTLGNDSIYPGLTNSGQFINIQSGKYWSAIEDIYISSDVVWIFDFGSYGKGDRGILNKLDNAYAWPVHDGDVGTPLISTSPSTE